MRHTITTSFQKLNHFYKSMKFNYIMDADLLLYNVSITITKEDIHVKYEGKHFLVNEYNIVLPRNEERVFIDMCAFLEKYLNEILKIYSVKKQEFIQNQSEKRVEVKAFISSLAFDMAKDEAFNKEIVTDEKELIEQEGSETYYPDWFQNIFDRWYDYFDNKLHKYQKD